MKLSRIVKFLNSELRVKRIKDDSRNGLQLNCSSNVRKIGFAVDGSLSTFKKAKKANVDFLIVHHGIKWKPQKYKEVFRRREAFLRKNRISLYGVHLPLDAHQEYGNNIVLCNLIGLTDIKKFGRYHGFAVGNSGQFSKPISIYALAESLNKKLKTECKVFPFGKKKVKTIGIVSGGGSEAIEEAVNKKLDCFLVGEISLGAYNRARDFELSTIAAGHYATETLGVKALQKLLEKRFNAETVFIDNPTGI